MLLAMIMADRRSCTPGQLISTIFGIGAGLPQEEKEKARLQAVTDGKACAACTCHAGYMHGDMAVHSDPER